MNLPRAKRHARWLVPAAVLAVAPKCLLCVLAYAGLGAALGLGGRELCGASAGPSVHWSSWLAIVGSFAIATSFFLRRRNRRTSLAKLP